MFRSYRNELNLNEKDSPAEPEPELLGTHHNLEVVAGNDLLPVLHPADGGQRVSRHGALQLDVGGLVGVRVRRVVQELRRNCNKTAGQSEESIHKPLQHNSL